MKDSFNLRAEFLSKRQSTTRRTESRIHHDPPLGLNNCLWKKSHFDEDFYISSMGIKYTTYNHFKWPRPLKP